MSSQPPRAGLTPLTSSLLPSVAGALQRRVQARIERRPVAESTPERGRGVTFESPDDDADEIEDVREDDRARSGERFARVESGTPSGAPRTYTLGQLVEMVREGRGARRRLIESGDPDGPEDAPPDVRTILGQALQRMR